MRVRPFCGLLLPSEYLTELGDGSRRRGSSDPALLARFEISKHGHQLLVLAGGASK